jgi:chitin disaccharide deacetylase
VQKEETTTTETAEQSPATTEPESTKPDSGSKTESKPATTDLIFDPAPVKAAIEEFAVKSPAKAANESGAAVKSSAPRRIWLCADDYGISPGVNDAIRELILRSRINATSVMTVAPSFTRGEAVPLTILTAGSQRIAIGLHVTLTAPFRPLSSGYGPLKDGAFLPLKATLRAAMLRQLKPQKIAVEIGAQIKAFAAAIGRLPDFIDGHQHVHIFPQVREAVIAAVRHAAPNAWLRHCGSTLSFAKLFSDRKGLLIDHLSGALQKRAGQFGLKTNPAFAGTYSFKDSADYAALFPGFLRDLPDDSVVMCHPGHVDDELKRLDTLTTLREKEYQFFVGDAFPAVLEKHGVTLS